MNYSFEYIDIILLAMIAGFIFIRLRGILGKKTGHEDDIPSNFSHDFEFKKKDIKKQVYEFDDDAKKEFLKGAKVAYETIITSFANGKIINIKSLLNKDLSDYYAILQVQKNASQDEIKGQFRLLAKKWHPDKKQDDGAEKKMAEINIAYEVLSNTKRRKMFDQHFFKNSDDSGEKKNV